MTATHKAVVGVTAAQNSSKKQPHRRPATLLATAILAALLALAGCAAIPTTGPVKSQSLPATDPETIFVEAEGPSPGASAMEITQGFIRAQAAGVNDHFRVAREFLTDERSRLWDPTVGTTVYLGEPALVATGPDGTAATGDDDDTVSFVDVGGPVSLAARVDEAGSLTEASSDAEQVVMFRLIREDGEWRISQVPDGTLVSQPNFTTTYRRIALEFLSTDERYLVPDVRWYPLQNLAAHATEGLLAGPSTWLRDAVHTAVPDRTTLSVAGTVHVSPEGVAEVDLSSPALSMNNEQRAVLTAQMNAVLMQVPQVRSVSLMSGGVDISQTPVTLARGPSAVAEVTAVVAGQLGQISGGEFTSDRTFEPFPEAEITAVATEPGTAEDAPQLTVVRRGQSAIVRAPAAGADLADLVPLLDGGVVSTPSIDRYGWVWSSVDGRIVVANEQGREEPIATWLETRRVTEVRATHDGSRVAIVSIGTEEDAQPELEIAAVVRDDRGAPTQLTPGIVAGGSLIDIGAVVWIGETTLAVLAKTSTALDRGVYTVPLGDWTLPQPMIDSPSAIAGSWDVRSLYVLKDDGSLVARSATGASWTNILSGVEAVAYPG